MVVDQVEPVAGAQATGER